MTKSLQFLLFVTLVTGPLLCGAWLLAQVGLNESYRVKHLSTHFSRVFLAIEVKSRSFPTLIEAQWPETYLPMRALIYPQPEMHANGNHRDCTLLQQAHWSQVDSLSRLWVLDMGSLDYCAPKLLVFDLIRNNAEVLRIDCGQFITANASKLLAVEFGPQPSPCHVEKFIYFLLADDDHLLAYDIVEQNWHRHRLVSRKYQADMETAFPVQPFDIAFGRQPHNELLISDADGMLYVSPLPLLHTERLQHDGNALNSVARVNDRMNGTIELEALGSLLGPSKGMMVDHHGALFYAVSRFGAVVRCTYKSNLTAEDNEIVYMTPKNIQQIFFDVDESVWLLTDRILQPHDHCFGGI